MKTCKIFFVIFISLAIMPVTINAQKPIAYFSYTSYFELDPAIFDLPCLTEKISGYIDGVGFSIYSETNGTWHYTYHVKEQGVVFGVGENPEKYEVSSSFTNMEQNGIFEGDYGFLRTFNYQWPLTIRHDGKLLLKTRWQYHGTWSIQDPLAPPIVDRFIIKADCF